MITLYSVSIVFIFLTIVCLAYSKLTSKTNSIDTTIVYTNKKQKKSDKVKDFVKKPSDDTFIDAIDEVADLQGDIPDNYVEINQHG
jgi:Na+-transporting methylmalonyl-CoA/oxaloacetate decarboxylase gamma subunit